jgi:hypothetical protein
MEFESILGSSESVAKDEEKQISSFSDEDPNASLVSHPNWFETILVPDHIDVRVYTGKETGKEDGGEKKEENSKKRGRDSDDSGTVKNSDRKGPEAFVFDVATPPNLAAWKQEDAKFYDYSKPPPKPRMTLAEIENMWPTLRSSPPHQPGFWHTVINKRTNRQLEFVSPAGLNHFSKVYPLGSWSKTNPKPPENSKVQLPASITETKYDIMFNSEAFDNCQESDQAGNSLIGMKFINWVQRLNICVTKLLLEKNRGWKQRFKYTTEMAPLVSQTIQTLKLHRSQIKACVRRIQKALSKSDVQIEARDDDEFLQKLEDARFADTEGRLVYEYDFEDLEQARESRAYIAEHKNLVERYDLLMENKRYDDSQGVDVVTNWRRYEMWPTLADVDQRIIDSVNHALVKEYKEKYTVKINRKVFRTKSSKKQKTSTETTIPPAFDASLLLYPEFVEAIKTHDWIDLPLYTVNEEGKGVLTPVSQRQLRLGDVIYVAVSVEAFDTSPQTTMGVRLVPKMICKVREAKKMDRDTPGSEEKFVVTFRPSSSHMN